MLPAMDPVMGAAEIAVLFGVSRQRVQQLATLPGFPRPLARLSMGKVWSTSQVRQWALARGRPLPGDCPRWGGSRS